MSGRGGLRDDQAAISSESVSVGCCVVVCGMVAAGIARAKVKGACLHLCTKMNVFSSYYILLTPLFTHAKRQSLRAAATAEPRANRAHAGGGRRKAKAIEAAKTR